MKLLKLEIGNLPKNKQFRSLHPGFKIEFHKLNEKGFDAMEDFNPFCFAGLNGSGKSNVLEALAAIFFHLECCAARFKPATFERHFRKEVCSPDAFKLEYLIGPKGTVGYTLENCFKITIIKEVGKAPIMYKRPFPFDNKIKPTEESLEPPQTTSVPEPGPGKIYLPDVIVGYSSGENEILSLPFIKNRLLHFDEYRESVKRNYRYKEQGSGLIYIDSVMSQAVLLACLLYEDPKTTLKPLKDELGIIGIRSFRMNLNVHGLYIDDERTLSMPILQHIHDVIDSLKRCATSWHTQKVKYKKPNNSIGEILTLDFYIDNATKAAFKQHFKTSFELFRFFQLLYELNANHISESIKEEAYKSKGFYTDGKLPVGSPEENVFYFLDYLILKEIKGESEPKELLLREFSDGEHQFLHTMGICLMLKERRSLLLLDEPETHFNPSWRAKFIKILKESIKAGGKGIKSKAPFNIHLLKDILLTSHSPFIISDCMPKNVLYFERNEKNNTVEAKSAAELGFNTYGTSVEIILDELFKYNQSIGDLSNKELASIKFEKIKSKEDVINAKKLISHLGDSIEKDLVLAKLNQIKV